ncbi:MAG TPA: hypothetical protein PLP21_04040 [Pyrinomonadaceae bacterium]|nr:hypothetical protein [Acidobacteriota bacterium]HQZ95462.1 hypothetical protein [Pyrinomonadaceae bacterium]
MHPKFHSEITKRSVRSWKKIAAFICIYLWLIFLGSCTSKPSDLRTLVPAESLIYLETNDLAAAIQPILDSDAFKQAAKTTPDLSALKGVQMAIAVTGFETSEERLTDENSVGRVQPRFVAVADTHAWNYQAVGFAEKKLGGFVADVYRSEPQLEKTEKHGGKYFTWTAKDGRKAFALVIDSLIYFGNDATAIEKCVAVKKGESDSIAKTGKLPNRVPESLASGYVSTDGVAQIAALAGLSFATQASDDEEVQSAVAGVLPKLIRGTVTDISWTATRGAKGYEDKFAFGGTPDTAPVMSETFAPASQVNTELFQFVTNKASAVTLYNLNKPNVAWRGLISTTSSKVDAFGAKMIGEFSNAFAEPYAISDAELFLSGVGPNIVSIRTDAEGDQPALIANITNAEAVRRALSKDLKPDKAASDQLGLEVLKDEDSMAVFAGSTIIAGDSDAVTACLQSKSSGSNLSPATIQLFRPGNSAASLSFENEQALQIADLLSEKKSDAKPVNIMSITETRFNRWGIERRTVSDLGFIGWLTVQTTAE